MTGKDLREQVRDFQAILGEIRESLREQGRLGPAGGKLLNSINGKCDELLLAIPVTKADYQSVEK